MQPPKAGVRLHAVNPGHLQQRGAAAQQSDLQDALHLAHMQLQGALRYLWAAHRPDDAVAVEAVYRWRRNDHPEETVEQLRWPPEGGR